MEESCYFRPGQQSGYSELETEVIIVGQGICGSLLAWQLWRKGVPFLLIDGGESMAASRAASGLINPVTGKRFVRSWMYEELLPAALGIYRDMELELGLSLVEPISLIQYFRTREERALFMDRAASKPFMQVLEVETHGAHVHNHFGSGTISPCYIVRTDALLNAVRRKLSSSGCLIEARCNWADVQLSPEGISYQDIRARNLICCEGAAAVHNPWFSRLPFSLNKGEALIVQIPDLPPESIYKGGYALVPVGADLFWVGSSFEWKYADEQPTEAFRESVGRYLREFLKCDFRILDHVAAQRPSSVDYRPFVGLHPHLPPAGIFNGMGTKGYLLAPYFSVQLAELLCTGRSVLPAVDVARFKGALIRGIHL